VHISETKAITSYGLLIEFAQPKSLDLAKVNRQKIDFVNTSLENIKIQSKDVLAPLIANKYLTEADLEDIDRSVTKDEVKSTLTEKLMTASNNFSLQINSLVKTELSLDDSSKIQSREIAATLGSDFVKTAIKVGITAFVLLILVVLFFFREIMPSALIIFSALFDMGAGLVGMAIFGLPLSLVTIPALLMLIGYSVDTDILLTTRVLKDRAGDPIGAANESIKTGLTMTFATIVTVLAMLVISYAAQMLVVYEIAIILAFGLVGDIIATWFFNAPTLLNYVLAKEKRRQGNN
jgi:preprotein translocase subunit SecF